MRRILAILSILPNFSFAQDWGQARILDGGVLKTGEHIIGLEIDLEDGWKTYYLDPGQNGLAPMIEITQDGRTLEPQIFWPEPHLFIADNLPSVGYKGTLLVPITFETAKNSQINVVADIGVCEHICVPARLEFTLEPIDGYSFNQIELMGASRSFEAEFCDWTPAQIQDLAEQAPFSMASDGEQSYIFSDWDAFAKQFEPPYHLRLYALNDAWVEPQACAES